MKCALCILLCVLCLTAVVEAQPTNPQYAWTLSESQVDPEVNEGAFVPGIVTLYLWLDCTNAPVPGGMSAAEFSLISSNPANIVLAFTPMNGFLNAGSATDLLLAVGGCPAGPVVAGSILILSNAPGQYCIGPNPLSGFRQVIDCEPMPGQHELVYLGYSNDGTPPCGDGPVPLCPIPVELQHFSVE